MSTQGPVPSLPSDPDVVDRLESEIRQLKTALVGRAVIDQAKGVLMRHFGVGADAAFQVLVRWSSHRNAKVSVLAQQITEAAARGDDAVAGLVQELAAAPGPPER